ncbi:MAG TPA: ABC transporter permease [Actinomycetota bacterium]
MAITAPAVERTSEAPHLRVGERLRVLVAHREILVNLIRKELKVKYAASVLGAIWSLLNPLVFLAVFSFVVAVLGGQIPNYPVYLLSGLLAWNLYSAALQGCARSVIDNSNLVKKVAFPHEVLPLAAIGVALVDYVLQVAVLLVFMLVSGFGFTWPELALFPLAFVALLAFTTALGIWLAALNVRYRDVGHLLNIALLVWFWGTPIVYAGALVQDKLAGNDLLWALYWLNPLVPLIAGMQRALYGAVAPEGVPVLFDVGLGSLALALLVVIALSVLALRFTWGSFFKRSGDLAEEL